ncbi:MAG: hypothetical protein ACMUEM_06475 [Flavobacteriales bacterium AspAUS03]
MLFVYRNNFSKDIYNIYNIQKKTVKNILVYNFSFQPKFYRPFDEWKAVRDSSKWVKHFGWFK